MSILRGKYLKLEDFKKRLQELEKNASDILKAILDELKLANATRFRDEVKLIENKIAKSDYRTKITNYPKYSIFEPNRKKHIAEARAGIDEFNANISEIKSTENRIAELIANQKLTTYTPTDVPDDNKVTEPVPDNKPAPTGVQKVIEDVKKTADDALDQIGVGKILRSANIDSTYLYLGGAALLGVLIYKKTKSKRRKK
jgi:hypothetical protein